MLFSIDLTDFDTPWLWHPPPLNGYAVYSIINTATTKSTHSLVMTIYCRIVSYFVFLLSFIPRLIFRPSRWDLFGPINI